MAERRTDSGGARKSGAGARPQARKPRQAPAPTARQAAKKTTAARQRPAAGAPSRKGQPASRRQTGGSPYNAPALWTKDAPKAAPSGGNAPQRALGAAGGALAGAVALVGRGAAGLLRFLGSLVARSRVALAVLAVAAVLAVGGAIDLGANWGKAYAGVKIGEVDVSGRTAEEMRAAVEGAYLSRLEAGSAVVYASEDAAARLDDAAAQAEEEALAEQRSVEEARAGRQLWTADATALGARLPTDDLVAEALAVGRESGGLGARLSALFGGWTVEVRADYAEEALEALAADIDATIGDPRVDFGISVSGGQASVTEGHDGSMVDRAAFARELDRALLGSAEGSGSFVARAEYAPLRIDRAEAEAACAAVNGAVAAGARFYYADVFWEATASDLGDWVGTRIEERDGAWALVPFVDEARAKPSILAHVQQARRGDAMHVAFERGGDGVTVRTDGVGEVPLAAETVRALDGALFGGTGAAPGAGGASAQRPAPGEPVEVVVGSGAAPASSTFDEALELGLIGEISSYTTEYTNGAGTENRNHNIRLVSDLLNDSVAPAGGTWSFNGTSGECNAERGFLGAGAIIDGEYDDAVGGGICQVATTVFNAVYEAGYPVPARRNHSLYIASYPAGRDAAVSWDDLDLVWRNDTASDVLMRTSYTDLSVTVTLYGVDPGYRVSTDVGEWAEGEKYKIRVERDGSLGPGTSWVKTAGTDGRSITVIRTVSSADGTVLHEDPFYSTYDPVTKVVIAAPDVKVEADDEHKLTEER